MSSQWALDTAIGIAYFHPETRHLRIGPPARPADTAPAHPAVRTDHLWGDDA